MLTLKLALIVWLFVTTLIVVINSTSYNPIPNFYFSGNNGGNAGTAAAALTACSNNQLCQAYNSNGYYIYDLQNAYVLKGVTTYINSVSYGVKFISVPGWDIYEGGSDLASYVGQTQSSCVYVCTNTAGCVGAVYSSSSSTCFLKKFFLSPSVYSDAKLLLPLGIGNCPHDVVTAGNCISSIPYNKIPNFIININLAQFNNIDSAFQYCTNSPTCVGFSSFGVSEIITEATVSTSSYFQPQLSQFDFFVPAPVTNGNFLVLQGWYNGGIVINTLYGYTTVSACLSNCVPDLGCVGALFDTSSTCKLLSNFAQPTQNANFMMMIPIPTGTSGWCSQNSYGYVQIGNLCIPPCPIGQQYTSGSFFSCVNCHPGQSTLKIGGTCGNCNAGFSSVAGGPCTLCAPGYTSVAGGLCYPCPNGIILASGFQCAKSYNTIPKFTFKNTPSTIGVGTTLDNTYWSCETDPLCFGFDSLNNYYSGLVNPSKSTTSNFYVPAVQFATQFVTITGWSLTLGATIILSFSGVSLSYCAYMCTKTAGCAAISEEYSICYLIGPTMPQPFYNTVVRMLLPVGEAGCLASANCVQSIPYNQIPNFDFPGNNIHQSATAVDAAYRICQATSTCVGFNSLGFYKYDFKSPVIAIGTNFFVNNVKFGTQFLSIKGWDNNPSVSLAEFTSLSNPSACAYQCTLNSACVGAVFDINNNCYLKSYFVQPNQKASSNMLIPVGEASCLASNNANCVQSIPYNQIPNFDFPGNNIHQSATTVDAAYRSCQATSTCVGFNSLGLYKSNMTSPVTSIGTNFFVPDVSVGMQFLSVKGWKSTGPTISSANMLIASPANCAWWCTLTKGCIGVVSDGEAGCSLLYEFSQPFQSVGYNLLIPVGENGCPPSAVSAGNCITPTPACSNYLPGGSLISLLINAEAKFKQLSIALATDPLKKDYISNGVTYLKYFLNTQVDFNGDGEITTEEVSDALSYRSIDATGLSLNLILWNCAKLKNQVCNSTAIDLTTIYNDALDCFLNSPKHLFDCSGVSVISNLQSQFPQSDNNAICSESDQSWNPISYKKPFTNWTYTANGQSSIGTNGKVCVYSNGFNIAGSPFNTISIGKGFVSGFQDPNTNQNVTSYRRVYCIAVTFNDGSYSYECSQGLFHVSIFKQFLSL